MGAQVESDLSDHDLELTEPRSEATSPGPWISFAAGRDMDYELAVSAIRNLRDHCAADVEELANRIGAQKLTLIGWLRADVQFARLVASKVSR
jgi:hypothetical protein